MKCPFCEGKLNYVEEVDGSFVQKISEKGSILSEEEFFGSSIFFIECDCCKHQPNYEFSDDNKVVLI